MAAAAAGAATSATLFPSLVHRSERAAGDRFLESKGQFAATVGVSYDLWVTSEAVRRRRQDARAEPGARGQRPAGLVALLPDGERSSGGAATASDGGEKEAQGKTNSMIRTTWVVKLGCKLALRMDCKRSQSKIPMSLCTGQIKYCSGIFPEGHCTDNGSDAVSLSMSFG